MQVWLNENPSDPEPEPEPPTAKPAAKTKPAATRTKKGKI